MNGICYWTIARNSESFNKEAQQKIFPFIDLRQIAPTNGINIHNFGMAQIGFTLHITSNKLRRDMILGSPGVYNWKGLSVLDTDRSTKW